MSASKRTWSPRTFAEGDPVGRTSCMVGLWLTPSDAALLATPATLPAESLHITLCLMEMDTTSMSDVQQARMLTTVDDVAAWTAPLTGEIAGMGRFYATDSSDGMDVVFAIPSLPDLTTVRQRIVENLGYAGLECKDTFGYFPHVSLAYVAPGAVSPIDAVPVIPLTFSALTVCIGDRMTSVPLRGWSDGGMAYTELANIAADHPDRHFRLFNEFHHEAAEPPPTIPIMPKPGNYEHYAYGMIAITPERAENFVANHNAHIYQQQVPVLIDIDHELKMYGAVGYLGDMFIEADGSVSANAVWTDRGRELIEADAFKYVSPEWWDAWVDGATGTVYQDVITGVALCTNPFFKDDSLRPLVAREGTLYAPKPQEGANVPASKTLTSSPNLVRIAEPVTVSPTKGQPMTEKIESFTMTEEVASKFTELEGRLTASDEARTAAETRATAAETALAANTERLEKIEQDALVKSFTDEVRGRSDANCVPYSGDVEYHVDMLMTLPADKRQTYMERERSIGNAARAASEGKFSEHGLGNDGRPVSNDMQTRYDAEVARVTTEEKLTKAAATKKVLRENKELAAAVAAGKVN